MRTLIHIWQMILSYPRVPFRANSVLIAFRHWNGGTLGIDHNGKLNSMRGNVHHCVSHNPGRNGELSVAYADNFIATSQPKSACPREPLFDRVGEVVTPLCGPSDSYAHQMYLEGLQERQHLQGWRRRAHTGNADPDGLHLDLLINRIDKDLFPDEGLRGLNFLQNLWRRYFYLDSPGDILVFFDQSSLPQLWFSHEDCVASMT